MPPPPWRWTRRSSKAPSEPANPLAARCFRARFWRCARSGAGIREEHLIARQFGRSMRCVAPSHDVPRRETRFTVSAWPHDAAPDENPLPAVTLLVADERRGRAEILPAALSSALSDPASDAARACRARNAPKRRCAPSPQRRAARRDAGARRRELSDDLRRMARRRPGRGAHDDRRGDCSVPACRLELRQGGIAGPGRAAVDRAARPHGDDLCLTGARLAERGAHDELARTHARLGDEEVRRNTIALGRGARAVCPGRRRLGLDPTRRRTSARARRMLATRLSSRWASAPRSGGAPRRTCVRRPTGSRCWRRRARGPRRSRR